MKEQHKAALIISVILNSIKETSLDYDQFMDNFSDLEKSTLALGLLTNLLEMAQEAASGIETFSESTPYVAVIKEYITKL